MIPWIRRLQDQFLEMWHDLPGGPESEDDRRARVQAGHDAKFAALHPEYDPEPEPEPETESEFVYCQACKNTDPKFVIGVEYAYGEPDRYDGVSEWRCQKCEARTGRWSGLVLRRGESEKRFGRGMRET